MKAITVSCPNCGAQMPVATMAPFVTCDYCQTEARVQRRTMFLQRALPVQQTDGRSLPVARQVKLKIWLVVVFAIFPLIMFGGIGSMILFIGKCGTFTVTTGGQSVSVTGGGVRTTTGSGSKARKPTLSWDGSYSPLLVDVNADGTRDLVGRVRIVGKDAVSALAAYDGQSHEQLWVSAPLGDPAAVAGAVLAAPKDTVVIAWKGGRVDCFELATGKEKWKIRLREQASGFCSIGDGLLVQLDDGTAQIIDLSTGDLQAAELPRLCQPPPIDSRDQSFDYERLGVTFTPFSGLKVEKMRLDRIVRSGSTLIVLGYRSPGTRVPMVAAFDLDLPDLELPDAQWLRAQTPQQRRAESKKTRAYERKIKSSAKLRWVVEVPENNPADFNEGAPEWDEAALGPDTIVIYYGESNSRAEARLAAFSRETGERRWDVERARDSPLTGISISNGFAYVATWQAVDVYDLGTGERVASIP